MFFNKDNHSYALINSRLQQIPALPGQNWLHMPHSILKDFFVWSKNVVESSKVVLLVGFSLVSINLQCKNCLSKPFASESRLFTFKLNTSTKTRVFCWKDLTLHVQMPHPWAWTAVKCPWVSRGGGGRREGCWSDCDRRLKYTVDGCYHFPPTDLMNVCFLFLCLVVLLSKVTNMLRFHVIKLRNLVKLVSTTFS